MRRMIAILLLSAAWPIGAPGEALTNSLSFFDEVKIIDDRLLVVDNGGIGVGKLPAGLMDARENITYATTQSFGVGDIIRSQGGQHNCYWKVMDITRGLATLHFVGHIRGFGSQNDIFQTTGYKRQPQPSARAKDEDVPTEP